ncbi:LOW QUALITY PROTEIN: hypothetical protein HID58_038174 [Brassica napus]|uniref:DNA primase large subunit C-terminal domain-containing protein n=3 Tax=Brassica napus TaxID=3708 RepID=A0ABQ8BNJ6_BRANA|nr:LOW QUALITY PROTEIN: hypothetical protein HID58_038174 [Brassica napus]
MKENDEAVKHFSHGFTRKAPGEATSADPVHFIDTCPRGRSFTFFLWESLLKQSDTPSDMSSYVLLANLRAGRCSNTAEVRLLRFWEARNDRKDGELMSLDMLLLDEQSTLIHRSMNSSRVDTFRRRLMVSTWHGLTKNSDSLTLRCPYASMMGLSYSGFAAMNSFWHWQILTENSQISLVKSTITDVRGPQRVMVTLRLEGEDNLRAALGRMGLSSRGMEGVIDQVRNKHYQLACTMTFEAVYGTSCDAGINHPNQYFEESRKILKSKTPLLREDNLRAALGRMGLSSRGMEGVIDQVRNKHYQLACTMTFEAVYGTSCDAGINHPNQYFEESRKILKSKTPLLREDNLRAALGRMGLSSRGMEGVIDQVRNKHYQLACTMTFEAVYGTSCDAGINHPNQYFEESRKILKSKTPLLREDNLRAALGRMGLSSRGMEGVIDQVRNKHYQLACTMTFEAVYGTSCDAGINHPNQYFEESRKILKSKTPLLRFKL